MKEHHEWAIKYITEHVEDRNPINPSGEVRTAEENQPFFMYLSFRAPHAPYSHNLTDEEIREFLPYNVFGKPGEMIGKFDEYIGNIMKTIHDLEVQE